MDYEKQAQDFLDKTGVKITAEFLKNDFHFDEDKDKRDIYVVTINRGKRSYKFNFGQSIAHSGKYIVGYKMAGDNIHRDAKMFNDFKKAKIESFGSGGMQVITNKKFEIPSAYSILSCLTKHDPETFKDFCGEFGYDEDSKRAEKTYNAVKEEYLNMCAIFSSDELEQLQEIQ